MFMLSNLVDKYFQNSNESETDSTMLILSSNMLLVRCFHDGQPSIYICVNAEVEIIVTDFVLHENLWIHLKEHY